MFTLKDIMNRFYLLIGKSFYDFKVFGKENLPESEPFVFVAHNHTSPLDFLIPAFVQRHRPDLHVMILDAGFEHPLIEWYSRQFNSLPVHKSPSRMNRGTLLEALKVLKQGKSILISLEGEMSWDGTPQPYKTGAAWLILHARVPFIPGVYSGAYPIWPRWQTLPKLKGKIRLEIGKPVLLDNFPDKIDNRLLEETNKRIVKEVNRIEKSVKSRKNR